MKFKLLEEITDIDVEFGNKAISLAWLMTQMYSVPDSICFSFRRESTLKNNRQLLDAVTEFMSQYSDVQEFIARSSSSSEDTASSSNAGFFKSISGLKTANSVSDAIIDTVANAFDIDKTISTMGVILQPHIKGKYSGVIFTSNPINWKKEEVIVSITKGNGHLMISGEQTGTEYILKNKELSLLKGNDIFPKEYIEEFNTLCEQIDIQFKYPADIEWLINNSGQFIFLQLRQITALTANNNKIRSVGQSLENRANTAKHNLRFFAKKFGIKISKAWALFISTQSEILDIKALLSELATDIDIYSIVLINPPLLNGKIYRKFCDNRSIVQELLKLIEIAKLKFLFIEIIIKEILPADYTGMIRKINGGYQVEVAKGHFVPKGVTEVSYYSLDSKFELLDMREVVQAYFYNLTLNKPEQVKYNKTISLSSKMGLIAKTLNPVFDVINGVIEFGISDNDEIILLDYSDENEPGINTNEISGIISGGRIVGIFTDSKVLLNDISSFDYHFKDSLNDTDLNNSNLIIWSEFPSLNLMKIVERIGVNNIGFVFSEISLLCHLGIRLRELGIPAIWYENHIDTFFSKKVVIDAETVNIPKEKRLTILE